MKNFPAQTRISRRPGVISKTQFYRIRDLNCPPPPSQFEIPRVSQFKYPSPPQFKSPRISPSNQTRRINMKRRAQEEIDNIQKTYPSAVSLNPLSDDELNLILIQMVNLKTSFGCKVNENFLGTLRNFVKCRKQQKMSIEYDVDRILDHQNGRYLILWKSGYKSWEPRRNLTNCPMALRIFEVQCSLQKKSFKKDCFYEAQRIVWIEEMKEENNKIFSDPNYDVNGSTTFNLY